MADGTDDLAELEAELETDADRDPEAAAAVAEAQSVLEDIEAADGDTTADRETADAAGSPATDTHADRQVADEGGSLLPSVSLPSPSFPSLSTLFSPRYFLLAVVAAVAGAVGSGFVPILGGVVAAGLGVFASAFVLGLVSSRRHYLETATAGAGVVGTLVFLGRLEIAVATGGSVLRLAAVGAGVGLLAALLGTYFGRDLRAGLVGRVDDATADLDREF